MSVTYEKIRKSEVLFFSFSFSHARARARARFSRPHLYFFVSLYLLTSQVRPVQLPLRGQQPTKQDPLRAGGQRRRDVRLPPAQQVGADQVTERDCAPHRRRGLERGRARVPARLDGQGQLRREDGQSAQAARHHKIHERPQLGQRVLDGRAREEEAVRGCDALGRQRHVRVRVADGVPLIQHGQPPPHRQQVGPAPPQALVGGDEQGGRGGREGGRPGGAGRHGRRQGGRARPARGALPDKGRPRRRAPGRGRPAPAPVPGPGGAVQDDDAQGRRPGPQLADPLVEQRGGRDEQGGAAEEARRMQPGEEGRHLHRLAQPHLVRQDAARSGSVQFPQPPHARALVREEPPPGGGRAEEAAVEARVAPCRAGRGGDGQREGAGATLLAPGHQGYARRGQAGTVGGRVGVVEQGGRVRVLFQGGRCGRPSSLLLLLLPPLAAAAAAAGAAPFGPPAAHDFDRHGLAGAHRHGRGWGGGRGLGRAAPPPGRPAPARGGPPPKGLPHPERRPLRRRGGSGVQEHGPVAVRGQARVPGGQAGGGGGRRGRRVGWGGSGQELVVAAARPGGSRPAPRPRRPALQAAHRVEGRQHAQTDEAIPLRLHQAPAWPGGGQGGGQRVVRDGHGRSGRGAVGAGRGGGVSRARPPRARRPGAGHVPPLRQGALQHVAPPREAGQALGEQGALEGGGRRGGAGWGVGGAWLGRLAALLVRPGVFVGLRASASAASRSAVIGVAKCIQSRPDGGGLARERGQAGGRGRPLLLGRVGVGGGGGAGVVVSRAEHAGGQLALGLGACVRVCVRERERRGEHESGRRVWPRTRCARRFGKTHLVPRATPPRPLNPPPPHSALTSSATWRSRAAASTACAPSSPRRPSSSAAAVAAMAGASSKAGRSSSALRPLPGEAAAMAHALRSMRIGREGWWRVPRSTARACVRGGGVAVLAAPSGAKKMKRERVARFLAHTPFFFPFPSGFPSRARRFLLSLSFVCR